MPEQIQQPRVRVAAIIQHENTLLMVRHQKGENTYWLLPGGGVDFGETLEQALIRELKEEARVDIEIDNMTHITDAISMKDNRHLIQISFQAHITKGKIELGIDPRVVEIKFIPTEKIKTLNIHPPINKELVHGLENGFTSEQHYLGNRWLTP